TWLLYLLELAFRFGDIFLNIELSSYPISLVLILFCIGIIQLMIKPSISTICNSIHETRPKFLGIIWFGGLKAFHEIVPLLGCWFVGASLPRIC
ncbi:hypothetical protein LINPERPRIM_LOCUS33751, partial [Linum perenne]